MDLPAGDDPVQSQSSPDTLTPPKNRKFPKSISMEYSSTYWIPISRSVSTSPPPIKKPNFQVSLSRPRLSSSQDCLEECLARDKMAFYQSKTLPTKGKGRLVTSLSAENYLEIPKKQKRKLSRKTKDINHPLHYPKSPEALVEFLTNGCDPNQLNLDGFFPIHTYISKQRKKKYVDLLYTLLSQSEAHVNRSTLSGMPALHMAVQEGNLHVIKLLLIFGAEVNSLNSDLLTSLDVAVDCGSEQVISLLQQLGAVQGEMAKKCSFNASIPRLKSFHDTAKIKARLAQRRMKSLNTSRIFSNGDRPQNGHVDGQSHGIERGFSGIEASVAGEGMALNGYASDGIRNGIGADGVRDSVDFVEGEDFIEGRERLFSNQSLSHVTLKDMEDGTTLSTLYDRLQQCINIKLDLSGSFSANTDEAIAITMQQKELLKHKKTGQKIKPYSLNVNKGSRILFLDGGGIRGLVQIEILEKLEKKTGRKVTELFDWIVGTSTGGIVALALVYAKRSLRELRQLYFKMKDRVFGSDRLGFAYNTEALEQLLIQEFGTTMRLTDQEFPKVIVTAVYKKTTMPELHFFNNCFHDEFSTQLVWKVARYTTAAPMFFTEYDNYVDGGVLANNPCSYGLSAIHNFHRQLQQKLDIALVVSVGSGIYPAEELGKTDAQEFLYFGKHWLSAGHAIKARAKSLVTLLTTALVESESVARSFSSRMAEQDIPFYRLNPQLDEVIPSGETDLSKLVNMLIKTKVYIMNREEQGCLLLDELVQLLHLVAEMSRKKIGPTI